MKLLAILLELGKHLNIPQDKLDSLVKDKQESDIDADALKSLYNEGLRVKLDAVSRNVQFDEKKVKDEAYKAAERKIKNTTEQLIRDTFDISDEAENIEALVQLASEKSTSKGAGKKGEITEADVETHPTYVKMVKDYKKQIDTLKESGTKALEDLKAEHEYSNTFNTVAKKGLEIFDNMKPVLSSDPDKAAKQKGLVTNLLSQSKYKIVEGEVLVLDEEGKPMVDDMKNTITLEKHVQSLAGGLFDFQVSKERSAPNGGDNGQGGNGNGGQMKYQGKLPTTKQEYVSMLSDDKIPLEQRQEIQVWGDSNVANLPE